MTDSKSFGKVVIGGGTGLVGGHLVRALRDRTERLVILTRNADAARAAYGDGIMYFQWLPHEPTALAAALEGADAIFHLSGAGIADHRWTTAYKEVLASSRIDSTQEIVKAIALCEAKPRVLVCASGVNYYGATGPDHLDESARPGASFLADVCVRWEVAAEQAETHGTRVVRARSGIALATEGGSLQKLLTPFKLGVGGRIASGQQGMSWIHIDDLTRLYIHAAETESLSGPVNFTAPNPVSNAEFTRTLGKVLRRPTIFPIPAFALKIVFGEMADELLVNGQYVDPKAALDSGFRFNFTGLEAALRDLLK